MHITTTDGVTHLIYPGNNVRGMRITAVSIYANDVQFQEQRDWVANEVLPRLTHFDPELDPLPPIPEVAHHPV